LPYFFQTFSLNRYNPLALNRPSAGSLTYPQSYAPSILKLTYQIVELGALQIKELKNLVLYGWNLI
jgi:hypothetical protein